MSDAVARVRQAIHEAIQRSVDIRNETFVEITEDIWLVDGGVNLQWLAQAAVDAMTEEAHD